MIVSMISKTEVNSMVLPEKIRGRFFLTNSNDMKIEIEGVDEKWKVYSNRNIRISDGTRHFINSCQLEELTTINMKVLKTSENILLLAEPLTSDRTEFRKYNFKDNMSISIGRKSSNDIQIDNKYVSGQHAVITIKKQRWHIEDNKSLNGVFVNGRRVSSQDLNYGDIIYIMGTIIIVGKSIFAINNPDSKVFFNQDKFKPYVLQNTNLNMEPYEDEELDPEALEDEMFYRSPRFKRDIEKAVFKIDPPPNSQIGEEMPIMMAIGPSITMGMASMVTAAYAVAQGNMISAVTSGCMILGTVLWPVLSKRYEKKRKRQKEALRQKKYTEYLMRIRDSFKEETDKQKEIIIENNVSVNECSDRITNVSRTLWERLYSQNDFLKVNIGKGNVPLQAEIKYPERKFEIESDLLEEDLLKICEARHDIEDVPITISLFENNITGVIGGRESVIDFANGIILQLATLYGYDAVKFVFIYDEEKDGEKLDYVKWLPHVWDNEKSIRFLAKNGEDVKELSSFFNNEFELRKELREEDLEEIEPYYVVFSFNKELALRADFLKKIYESKKNLHFSVLTFYDELKNLPKECSNVIELNNESGKVYDKNDITGKAIEFYPDIFVGNDLISLSTMLSNIHLNVGDATFKLPKMITFLEMYNAGKIEHLNVLNRWKENDPTKSLEADIGVDTLGDPFKLDLHEKYHGPHGLIAGMTGSGKSEFIMSYILSMAINYHPYEVAFVLIDYKGGGMAKAFEKLPHTAGIITNLDGGSIKRSLISIQSELRRRQAIFAEASKTSGISNIDIYKYQKMYRDGVVDEPLQHLFIISDEFAELKTQQKDFMTQLVSAARIGRSLGVHLILATQKPSGVVDDQIWSNSKFKACLKVQDKSDSMEMLKRPEAAELKDTGRFYLQVGYNELFKLGQSAWSGAPYYPSDKVEENRDESIDVIDNVGRVISSFEKQHQNTIEKPMKQIDAITEYLSEIAIQENIKIRSLWLEPIPEKVFVKALIEKYNHIKEEGIINPVIGEYDDPENQSQHILTLPLSQNGVIAVYGAAGSGKTRLLTTCISSLLGSYTPEEVNLYILDFYSETLLPFSQAPHVGDVVLSHETEKVVNLIKLLMGQMEKRKKLFAEYGGNIESYNKYSTEKVPAIVVAISNYTAFGEIYEDYEGEMLKLTRDGKKYGIYFILTASSSNGIRFRMQQNVSYSLALQLTDDADYSSILGKTEGLLPSKFEGRGLCKIDGIHEFQTARYFEGENEFDEIRDFCKELKQMYSGSKVRGIPVLPEKVNMEFIRPYVVENSLNIPIGVEINSLEVEYFDLCKHYISFIQSEGSDYMTFVSTIAKVVRGFSDIKTTIFDVNNEYVSENFETYIGAKDLIPSIDMLFNLVVERHNLAKDAEDTGTEMPVFEKELYIIPSLSDIFDMLEEKDSDVGIEQLKLILEKGRSKLNLYIIIAEEASRISKYNYDKWYKNNVSAKDGIWIGRGIADQYNLKLNKTTSEMNLDLTTEYGYAVNNGNALKIKLLNESEDE